MSRKANRKPARRGRRPQRDRVLISRETAKRVSFGALWLVLLAGVGWGLYLLDERYAGEGDASTALRLVWVDLPPHMAPDGDYARVIESLDATLYVYAASDGAPLPEARPDDPQLCERIYKIVADSPWVHGVKRVSRRSDNVILIEASFRKPFTYIGAPTNAYLVDREASVLQIEAPLRPGEPMAVLPLVGVTGRAPREGERWEGEAIEKGLDLIEYLARAELDGKLPYRSQLTAVDVDGYDSKIHCCLRVNTVYSYVTWGRAIGLEAPYDATPEEKLAALGGYYASEGSLPREPVDLQSPEWLETAARSQ